MGDVWCLCGGAGRGMVGGGRRVVDRERGFKVFGSAFFHFWQFPVLSLQSDACNVPDSFEDCHEVDDRKTNILSLIHVPRRNYGVCVSSRSNFNFFPFPIQLFHRLAQQSPSQSFQYRMLFLILFIRLMVSNVFKRVSSLGPRRSWRDWNSFGSAP